jgi:hypothetical protein
MWWHQRLQTLFSIRVGGSMLHVKRIPSVMLHLLLLGHLQVSCTLMWELFSLLMSRLVSTHFVHAGLVTRVTLRPGKLISVCSMRYIASRWYCSSRFILEERNIRFILEERNGHFPHIVYPSKQNVLYSCGWMACSS